MTKKRLFNSNGVLNDDGFTLEHQFKSLIKPFIKKNWKKYQELDLENMCGRVVSFECYLNDSRARKRLKKIWDSVSKK